MLEKTLPFSPYAVPILSDIHGHAEGLLKVIARIKEIGIQNPPLICGDLIWTSFPEYNPVRVLNIIMDMPLMGIVAGNTDLAMIDDSLESEVVAKSADLEEQETLLACKRNLTATHITYLRQLPMHFQFDFGGHLVLVTHASPTSQDAGLDLDLSSEELAMRLGDARYDYLITGHLHLPFSRQLPHQRMHFSVGAVGKHPNEYDGAIEFAIMDRTTDGLIFVHKCVVD
jgi:predicted phosphodiesterase